ncbi:hypothetical protein [Oceanobacter mangrovi]|uniref:hypothetical protein n=1 Tax=Oceanobacter mangrovi TaxID=2862510 RepID=UPI001C8DCC6A|nr:hypothetical protein [Oceanobacter mangrovi]
MPQVDAVKSKKSLFESVMSFLGFIPTAEEAEILTQLRSQESSSMKVLGRGTLVMDVTQARSTKKSKEFIAKVERIVHQG